MRHTLRYRPLVLWLGSLTALLGTLGGSCDECDPAGASWCEGDHLLQCQREQHGGSRRTKVRDCTKDSLVCSENAQGARCALEAPRCADEGVEAVCVGDVRATCEVGDGHAVPDEDCASNGPEAQHCVESDMTARCSPFQERCPEDGAERCAVGSTSTCMDHIWSLPAESESGCADSEPP